MSRLTSQQVWEQLSRASFAVLAYRTPEGEPRCSGVVYAIAGSAMYAVVGGDSWKARHISRSRQVAVTVPVRRGGIMSLVMPIPPATITFPADARVYPSATLDVPELPAQLVRPLPRERRAESTVIEIRPRGHFVTYGIGVPLMQMRHPELARTRLPVAQP